eukprot:8533538-Lingulodinium_polyedra.AAC.1
MPKASAQAGSSSRCAPKCRWNAGWRAKIPRQRCPSVAELEQHYQRARARCASRAPSQNTAVPRDA